MATKTKDASTRIMKPKMPEPRPSVSLASLKAELMNDFSRYSNGSMAMTMGGVGGEITQNGKNVGSIYGALGGGIVVYLGSGDDKFRTVWSLSMKDIFIAVQDAVEQQYAKGGSHAAIQRNRICPDCGGDCDSILAAAQKSLAEVQ